MHTTALKEKHHQCPKQKEWVQRDCLEECQGLSPSSSWVSSFQRKATFHFLWVVRLLTDQEKGGAVRRQSTLKSYQVFVCCCGGIFALVTVQNFKKHHHCLLLPDGNPANFREAITSGLEICQNLFARGPSATVRAQSPDIYFWVFDSEAEPDRAS